VTPDIYTHGEAFNKTHGENIYLLSGHWPVPGWIAAGKMKWLKDKHIEKLMRARSFLMISDWAGYMLGGRPYTEGSSACETGLFDVEKGEWAWKMIDEFDIPSEIFPKVMQSGVQVSQVTSKAAKGTSLPEQIPSSRRRGRYSMCLIGCNAYKASDTVAVGGTTTPVQMVTKKPVFDEKKRTWTNMHIVSGKWIIESGSRDIGSSRFWTGNATVANISPRKCTTIE
jgi:sugar (pentulose or hexulose) kinase